MAYEIKIKGLNPLPKDERDLSLGALFSLPSLDELPQEFITGRPTVVQQGDTDFCAAAASCAVRELQEGVPLSFEWSFALTKWMTGDPDSFGVNLRDICKAHQKYGAIEKKDAPFSLENKSPDFLRHIENWPHDLFTNAREHRAGSFFAITGPYDHFDNIRACMWKFQKEKIGVLFGVLWSWPIQEIIMTTINSGGSGHALAQLGWSTKGMFIQNSAGIEAGEGGRHYFSRELINQFVDVYGAFAFHDMSADDAFHLRDNGIKYDDNWLISLFKTILNLFK